MDRKQKEFLKRAIQDYVEMQLDKVARDLAQDIVTFIIPRIDKVEPPKVEIGEYRKRPDMVIPEEYTVSDSTELTDLPTPAEVHDMRRQLKPSPVTAEKLAEWIKADAPNRDELSDTTTNFAGRILQAFPTLGQGS